jgi:hypothetical protein
MRVAAVVPSLLIESDPSVIIRSLWGNTSVASIGIETPVVFTVASGESWPFLLSPYDVRRTISK